MSFDIASVSCRVLSLTGFAGWVKSNGMRCRGGVRREGWSSGVTNVVGVVGHYSDGLPSSEEVRVLAYSYRFSFFPEWSCSCRRNYQEAQDVDPPRSLPRHLNHQPGSTWI